MKLLQEKGAELDPWFNETGWNHACVKDGMALNLLRRPLQSKCYNLFSGVGKSVYVCAWAYTNFIHANFLYICTLVHIFICIRSAYAHTPHFNERK